MAHRRFGPPLPRGKGLGKFRLTGIVLLCTLPFFMVFQNFGKNPENFKFTKPTDNDTIAAPSDLLTSDGTSLSFENKPIARADLTVKAWQIQGADEHRRALRLLAAQISELFPQGQISTDVLFKTFSSKEFAQSTTATQLVAGDAVPVCQWLQTAYSAFLKRFSTDRRCKNETVDLENENNQDCRFQAMIEKCDQVPPLPFPSLYDSWRLCGQTSCELQITTDLSTYLQFFQITGDASWLINRFVPMATEALKQTEGPFVLLPPMEFAQEVLENPETSKLKTDQGISLEQKALEYVMAFDRSWSKEFKDINNLKSDLYRPTAVNVSRFHALLKRSKIQQLMADPAANENARLVRQFARRLKSEVFIKGNLNLGYTPEVYQFIVDAALAGLEFTVADVGTLRPNLKKHIRSSPWLTQPRSFGLLLSTFVSE